MILGILGNLLSQVSITYINAGGELISITLHISVLKTIEYVIILGGTVV
jgi:hypothetical protein